MNLDRILRELTDMNLASVAKKADVGYNGLCKVASGETKNPGIEMVEKLTKYFNDRKEFITGDK